jgi:hypothetical protein
MRLKGEASPGVERSDSEHLWAESIVGSGRRPPRAGSASPDPAGRAAFNQADYESALSYFRHAYQTSGRGALRKSIAEKEEAEREPKEAPLRWLRRRFAKRKKKARPCIMRGRAFLVG